MHKKSVIFLLLAVSFLVTVGFVILISTCVFSAHAAADDGYREAKRQGMWLVLAICACCWAAFTDYRFWKRNVWLLFGGICLLLALCFVPGIGMERNGEWRWIGAGPLQVQPSEFGKIVVVVFVAYWFSRYPDSGRHVLRGFGLPLAILALPMGLILFEVDIGTTAVLSSTVFLLLFVAGVNWKYLTSLGLTAVVGFIGMMSYAPDRMERLMAFIDPEKHRLGAGFQQWVSLMAFGSGGVTGRGLGEGRLKMLYMPFAHTDFIFPMIGEELGMITTVLVVVAFIMIGVAGFSIAFYAPDRFGSLLAIGLSGFICFQAFFNIGVTTSLLPNTGLTLPFVSYGGSSLLIGFLAVGILINIFRQGNGKQDEDREWVSRQRITPRV